MVDGSNTPGRTVSGKFWPVVLFDIRLYFEIAWEPLTPVSKVACPDSSMVVLALLGATPWQRDKKSGVRPTPESPLSR